MQYPDQWTAGLSDQDKRLFEELLGINNKVLDRLAQICYNILTESENSANDYDNPNWALRQADLIGRRKVLNRIIKLCTPIQERDPAHN